MLKFVSSTVKGHYQFVEECSHTLLFAQNVKDFCACTKFFDECQQSVHIQRVCSLKQCGRFVHPQYVSGLLLSTMQTVSASTVR